MTYLQDLMELAVYQMVKTLRWLSDHYMEVSFAIVGIPTLGFLILEAICWKMLAEQNAALDVLAQMMR